VAFPILQIIFTILAAFLVFRIGNKLYHPYVGGIAGLFFLIDPNTILHALIIQTDIWNACLTVFLVYLFVVPSSLHSKAGMFSLGLLVGFSTLVRPISMYLIALFSAFYCFFERGSHAKKILVNLSLLLIGFSIILLPWVIRNKVQTGVAGISSVKDYNFFHYYLPSYMAYKQGISEADAKKILTSELRPVSLEQTDQLKYSPNVNEVWMRHFKEDPLGYAGLHFIKTIPVFLSSGTKTFFEAYGNMIGEPVLIFSRANMTDLLIHLDITALFREVVKNPLVMAEEIGLALICLFAFLAIFFKRNRPYTILLLCIIIYFAFLTGTVAYSRFRLPIAPFLFLLASCSIREFWIVYKNRYMSTR
jgi:hypothetical protein